MNQVLFPLGLVPVMAWMLLRSRRIHAGPNTRAGSSWAFLTGVLGGVGNVAFYAALVRGKVSVIVPMTGLFPLVTVLMARLFLKEKVSVAQMIGLVIAMAAIYLLSV
jgi:transporter family protein